MFTGISGFISGVILLYFCAEFINSSLHSLKITGFFIALGLALACVIFSRINRSLRRPLWFVAALSLGFGYALEAGFATKDAMLPAEYDNQTLLLEGFLCGLPKPSEFSVAAEFCLTSLSSASGHELNGSGYKALIRWPLDLQMPDQPLRLQVRARRSRSTVNFAGFAYEKHLFYQGIIFNGSVQKILEHQPERRLSPLAGLRLSYHQLRFKFARFSEQLLQGLDHQGMLRALLLGDRSRLSAEDHKVLANTGTQHLIAISGLHVGIVMLGLYVLLPKSPVSLFPVALLGGVYILLVGFSPSAQRAWVMSLLALFYMAGLLRLGKWRVYLLALFVVLLLDPLATLNPGFWFSFICVAILLLLASSLQITVHPWLSLVVLQCLLLLGLAPVYSISGLPNGPASILANLMAVPWISLLILPLVLLCFLLSLLASRCSETLFEWSKWLYECLDTLLELMMAFLQSLSLFSNDWLLEPWLLVSVAYLLCFMALLQFTRFTTIKLLLIPVMLLVLLTSSRMPVLKDEFLVFDAGQGLALAMSFEGQTWLFDTGPAFGRLSTVDQAILPYLRRYRLLDKTAGVIVSHGDADHAGDVVSLLDVLKDSVRLSGEPERLRHVGRFEACHKGMRWHTENTSLEVLYPFEQPPDGFSDLSSNNHSCVLLYRMGGKRFLLMGDLEAEAELALVQHYRHMLKADVLVAGHHGAADSTSYALLKHVRPDYVVFSAGYANTFGHPSVQVLERIDSLRLIQPALPRLDAYQTLNTADSGALRFQVDAVSKHLRVISARDERAALWIDSDFVE